MKRIYLWGAICAMAAAVSCQNEDVLPEVTLDYAKGQAAEIIAPPEGGKINLGFTASSNWDVTTVVSWLGFEALSGKAGDNVLVVTVDENTDLDGDRTGVVRIHSDNKELLFTISQLLNDKTEAEGETSIQIDAQGGSGELKFSATKDWTASTEASWLSLSKTSGGAAYSNVISVSAPLNTEAPRSAEVIIVSGESRLTYTVSQDFIDGVAVIGEAAVTIGELGGEAVIKFSAVTDWTASTDAAWLTLSAANGAASAETSITVSAGVNVDADRTATVTVNGENNSIEFTVTQKMATSTLAYTSQEEGAGELYVLAKNGGGNLDFIAVEAWTAATDADWITIDSAQGEPGTFSIGMTAAENTTLAYRNAVVTITSASGTSTLDFTIYQNSAFGDYCGTWTASGTLTVNSETAGHSEHWIFADSDEEPGNGGMQGLLGETDYWGAFTWDADMQGAKIETGADNAINIYNFNGIGLAAIAPVYRCSFQTDNGVQNLIFYSFTNSTTGTLNEYPIYSILSDDRNSMTLAVFTYDQYPNPTTLVPTNDFIITYGLFEVQTDEEGNLTGFGDFMGYAFGGYFSIASVTRTQAATAAINNAVSKVSGTSGKNAQRLFGNGGKIRTISSDQLVKCEKADFFIK